VGKTAAAYDQDEFQGRDDDVALNSATFNGGGGNNGNWTQLVNVNFRIRYVIQETAGGAQGNQNFTLFFDHEGAGYVEWTTATPIQPAPTTQYAQGDTTTQVLGAGTYVAGNSEGGVDDNEDTGNIDYAANEEAEVEFCCTIDSAQVNDGDTIAVRVYESDGTALGSYTQTPTITVDKPAGITLPIFSEEGIHSVEMGGLVIR
jgi:hypothetical protein